MLGALAMCGWNTTSAEQQPSGGEPGHVRCQLGAGPPGGDAVVTVFKAGPAASPGPEACWSFAPEGLHAVRVAAAPAL